MVYHSKKKELIFLLVENLKKYKNLPFVILTNNCPSHKKKCKKHHGEIVITSYNKKTKKFHLKYYSIHERGIQFQYDQPVEFIHQLILKFIESTGIRNMNLNYLRKFLDKEIIKTRRFSVLVRYNEFEYKIVKKKAFQKNLDVATFVRKKSIR